MMATSSTVLINIWYKYDTNDIQVNLEFEQM